MTTVYTRASKGSALTWAEGDANITNLNNDKMENFTVAGDSGTSQTIAGGNTLTISGGTGLSSVASATDTITINLDNTSVTPASYTLASITVDAQGRITSASNGTVSSITVTQVSDNATYYPIMSTTNGTGSKSPVLGTNFTMNPSTGALTCVSLTSSGSITPNSTGGPNINFGTSTLTASAWTTLGISLRQQARNYTDSSSTGTVAVSAINGFGIPTLNSSNAITITEAANIYVQPPAATGNTTITTAYGLISTGRIKASDFVGTVGATTAAAGTFTTLTANTSATLKGITEGAIHNLGTTGGTIAPNVANGNVQVITLNSALTINAFTSPVAGQSLTLIINGGTAYTSITSTMKFAGGIKTLTGTAGCVDILSVYYDGTNYWASLAKGFA